MVSNSNSSNSKTNPVPTAPTPQNSYYYENGVLKSSSMMDKSKDGIVTNAYSTPQEQQIQNNATDYMGKLVGQIPNAVDLSPESMQKYSDAYAQPQINALNLAYNQAKGQATQAATSHGVQNSVGFGNYEANVLEKNRAQGLADIQSNAYLQGLDLPNQMLSPYVNQFNLYNAASTGQQAILNQNQNNAMQGSQVANNSASQTFQNQLAQYQARAAQLQQQSRQGLSGFFTGGY